MNKDKDDMDYYVESVADQLLFALWLILGTLTTVGVILGIALR